MKKIKYIIFFIALLISYFIYLFYMMIWLDNNTVYTMENITETQNAILKDEMGINQFEDVLIQKVTHNSTWGNDIRRSFRVIAYVPTSCSNLSEYIIENEDRFTGGKSINMDNETEFSYYSTGYIPLERYIMEEGIENTVYKNMVSLAWLIVVILLNCLILIPYKRIGKYFKKLLNVYP